MSRTLKRTYHISGDEAQGIAKRLKRVERIARNNRGEMKHKTFVINASRAANSTLATHVTALARGDSISEREGNFVKVWRIEVRGLCSNNLDQYIIQAHNTSVPSNTDFTIAAGAYIADEKLNSDFTEWRHYQNIQQQSGDVNAFKFVQKFRNGITIRYNGALSSNATDNMLYWVVVNREANPRPINATCRVWYTDN